jgi:hypothetical protein
MVGLVLIGPDERGVSKAMQDRLGRLGLMGRMALALGALQLVGRNPYMPV